jgi:predicted negative regulator of RcsB-dependent stress response
MKIWTWIKSLSLVGIIGAIGGATLMIYNAWRASQLQNAADHNEKALENMVQDHTKKSIDKAAKLQAGVTKDKQKAAAHAVKAKAHLEKLSEDQTMADIANDFNSRKPRVRNGTSTTT